MCDLDCKKSSRWPASAIMTWCTLDDTHWSVTKMNCLHWIINLRGKFSWLSTLDMLWSNYPLSRLVFLNKIQCKEDCNAFDENFFGTVTHESPHISQSPHNHAIVLHGCLLSKKIVISNIWDLIPWYPNKAAKTFLLTAFKGVFPLT